MLRGVGLKRCRAAGRDEGILPGGSALLDDGTAADAVVESPLKIARSSATYSQSNILRKKGFLATNLQKVDLQESSSCML
jgi:hypothetical protein